MSDAASTTSVNPNVNVGDEGKTASKANSAVTFDDVDLTEEPKPKAKPKLVKDEPKEKDTKVRGDNKEETDPFSDADGDKKTAKPKEKPESGKDDPAKPKAKVHKFKSGDQEIQLPSDAVIPVKINGKVEEVKLQDIIDNHSGKTNWDKKFNELHIERQEFGKQRESLNTLVSNLYEKSQKDPEAAWDFLAELTKQDPAKLKMDIVRKQFAEMAPLFDMEPDERERWFKEKELDYRDKAHANRAKADTEREAKATEDAQRAQAAAQYGIDENAYTNAAKVVGQYLSKVDPKFDGKVTPQQVIYADRHLMALEVIGKNVPHLEKHEKFDSIVGDIVTDLMRHPQMNREKLGSLLQDVWGDDDKKGLKTLARKASKDTQVSDNVRPNRRSEKSDPVTFEDLD